MVHMSRMANVVGVFAALFAGSASADPVIAFGLQSAAGGKVLGAPSTARSTFEGLLTDVGRVDFTGLTGTVPSTLAFQGANNSASLGLTDYCQTSTAKRCKVNTSGSGVGRFNTTGATSTDAASGEWWDADGEFTLTFDKVISAFGFYATDLGDLGGQLYITLRDEDGVLGQRIKVAHEVAPPAAAASAAAQSVGSESLAFWGFTDTTKFYSAVTFSIEQRTGIPPEEYDVFGFDDLLVGSLADTPPPGVPEPASLALVGLSLAALAASRRRQSKSA